MKRIFIPTSGPGDWAQLLAQPVKHWKSGKSAMTLAASWEAAHPRMPPEVLRTSGGGRPQARFARVPLVGIGKFSPSPSVGVQRGQVALQAEGSY